MGIIFSRHDSASGLQSIKISIPPLLSHLSGVTNWYLKPPGGAESAGRRVLGASQTASHVEEESSNTCWDPARLQHSRPMQLHILMHIQHDKPWNTTNLFVIACVQTAGDGKNRWRSCIYLELIKRRHNPSGDLRWKCAGNLCLPCVLSNQNFWMGAAAEQTWTLPPNIQPMMSPVRSIRQARSCLGKRSEGSMPTELAEW